MKQGGILKVERDLIAAKILEWDIGIGASAIITARQRTASDGLGHGDIWQEVAMKIEAAPNNIMVVIQCAEGKTRDPNGEILEQDVTFTVTMVCTPVCRKESTVEEDVFHDLITRLHTLQTTDPRQHPQHGFRVTGWGEMTEMPETIDLLARQIILTKRVVFGERPELP